MVDVNLYPWREKRALFEAFVVKKTLAISVALTVLAALAAHAVVAIQIQALQSREAGLQETLNTYHQEKLQPEKNQAAAVKSISVGQVTQKLIRAISRLASEQLCLTSIELAKSRLIFTGEAASVRALTDYLQYWEVDGIFSDIQLESIHELIDEAGWRFRFHANLVAETKDGSLDPL